MDSDSAFVPRPERPASCPLPMPNFAIAKPFSSLCGSLEREPLASFLSEFSSSGARSESSTAMICSFDEDDHDSMDVDAWSKTASSDPLPQASPKWITQSICMLNRSFYYFNFEGGSPRS